MEVNAGVEGKNTCPECGRVWLLTQRKVPQRDKDDISCICGRTLVSWNGGCVWTATLIDDIVTSIWSSSPARWKSADSKCVRAAWSFDEAQHTSSPVSTTRSGECNASSPQNDSNRMFLSTAHVKL